MTNPCKILCRNPTLANLIGDPGPNARIVPGWPDTEAVLAAHGPDIDILAIGGMENVDAALLDRLPNLRLVCCVGAGFDLVDLPALRARNVRMTVAAGINAPEVAELAVALLLHLICGLAPSHDYVSTNHWHNQRTTPMRRAVGRHRIGLVGFGAIGQAIADRLRPFGAPVRWWAPHPNPAANLPRAPSLTALTATSDALILCCRADAANRHMVDAGLLAAMPRGSYLVNIARGSLIDEPALRSALACGHLAGAALDVFDHEPTPAEAWAGTPNILLSPHRGGMVDAALDRQVEWLRDAFARHHAGQPMLSLVQ